MNYYIHLYTTSILIAVLLGSAVWHRRKDISGFSFFLFTIFTGSWYFFYFLFFSGSFSVESLLLISRIDFLLSIFSGYSLLSFIYHYPNGTYKHNKKIQFFVILSALGIAWIYIFSPFIVSGLKEDTAGVYREMFGFGLSLHIMLHLIWICGLFILSFSIKKRIDMLSLIRFNRIVYSAFSVFFTLIILQLILPYLGIWILEKEIIFLYIFFVVSVYLNLRRYYFSHLGYGIGKTLFTILSVVISISIVEGLGGILYRYFGILSTLYGGSMIQYDIIKMIMIFILYFSISYYAEILFLSDSKEMSLARNLQKIKKELSRSKNIRSLNDSLGPVFENLFYAKNTQVEVYQEGSTEGPYKLIGSFFSDNPTEKVLINDIVFLETHIVSDELKNILSKSKKNIFLFFPLYTLKDEYIGHFCLEKKRFGDFYSLQEIDMLKEFSLFLEIQLKYIRTYDNLEDLSMNLDKKVDEKTIEYNNLINRQKEFIGIISHEIRSPLSTLIFQSDSILDDISKPSFSKTKLKEELKSLSDQLVRTSGLLSKIFSVEYYDTHAVNLFREKIQFSQFIEYEIELFARVNPDIVFIPKIDEDIGFIQIDKVQFQQVITNLIDNAIKFAGSENPTIAITSKKQGKKIILQIEDNGKGFDGIDPETLFDKYTTGTNKNIGLGMGLYLCKKIVSMHDGTIDAAISKKYHGACFIISLPIG